MDQSHNEIMAEWLHAMGRAIEGFRGPLQDVQSGDLQRALELLDECPAPPDPALKKEVIEFLDRLRPGDDG